MDDMDMGGMGGMGMGGTMGGGPSLFYFQQMFWAVVGTAIGVATLVNLFNQFLCWQRSVNNTTKIVEISAEGRSPGCAQSTQADLLQPSQNPFSP